MGFERQIGEGAGRLDTGPLGFGQVKSILFASLCTCSVDPLLSMGHLGKVGNPAVSAAEWSYWGRWECLSNQRSVTVLVSV